MKVHELIVSQINLRFMHHFNSYVWLDSVQSYIFANMYLLQLVVLITEQSPANIPVGVGLVCYK